MDSMNPFILLLLVIILMAIAVFIGLALGNVFTKDKPMPKTYTCDYEKCNEQLTNWIKDQRGDFDNSTKQIAECRACPERAYSQLTNEVRKYSEWKSYDTPEAAVQAIIL
jgi:cell shape-determining protein MreC